MAGKRRVLLLEAGPRDRKLEIRIPAAFYKLFKTSYDWAFLTEREPHLGGRQLFIPRGRTLGGSSSINAMIYIRGNRADYAEWERLAGPNWSWNRVAEAFARVEGTHDDAGRDAHITVSDLCEVNPLSRAFVDAAVEIGIPRNSDFNGDGQDGVGFYRVTQRDGRRWSAADAFLRPASSRPNLLVESNARALRVLFQQKRATGVEYEQRGRISTAQGSEVILAGGAINSPQLLLLSGVGPASELRRLGIDVVADRREVGENLQDHPVAGVIHHSTQQCSLDSAETIGNLLRWIFRRRGPLTSNVAEAGGFVRTENGLAGPDLQFHFAPCWFVDHGLTRPKGNGFSIGATLITPHSRGRVRLRSAGAGELPIIEGNYLSDPRDLDRLLYGVRLCRRVAASPAFTPFRGAEFLPGAGIDSDAALSEAVRQRVEMLYHPVGTCRMGSDEQSVVDPQLRVRGVDNLRVVDASVMPVIPRGNTNAPTMMLAQRAAEMMGEGDTRVGA